MTKDEAKARGYDFEKAPDTECKSCSGEGLLYGVSMGDVNLGVWECPCTVIWEEDLTRAQTKWLAVLRDKGFVAWGTWGSGQRNRPLRRLIEAGFAKEGWGPVGSCLKMQGVLLDE